MDVRTDSRTSMGPETFFILLYPLRRGRSLLQEGVQYIQYVTELSQYTSVNIGTGIIPMSEYLNMMTTVGASGAVYAILLAFGMLFPNQQLFIFPLPFPIKAKILRYRICPDRTVCRFCQ